MEIVKKNFLSILCGVIALIALIALEWPISGMFDQSQKNLDAKKQPYSAIMGLETQSRTWPIVNPTSSTPEPLKQFPNKFIIQEGDRLKAVVHQQAEQIAVQTRRDNEHQPLLRGILPNPGDRRYEFRDAYLAELKSPQDEAKKGAAPASRQSQPRSIAQFLQATSPPDHEAIIAEGNKLWDREYKSKLIKIGDKPALNGPQVVAECKAAVQKLAQTLPIERATRFKMYIDTGALVASPAMQEVGKAPAVDDIWYAQNMLWIAQDVADGISHVNASAKNVMDAPVKQLVKFEVAPDFTQYVTSTSASGTPAADDPQAKAGKMYYRSPTGRVCNPLYDVIHFTLTINVDARKIPQILAEIQKGKLITIYQADAAAVDAKAQADSGYIYGDAPVVKLTLEGEELFLRDWTTKLMPDTIKKLLNIPVPGTPA